MKYEKYESIQVEEGEDGSEGQTCFLFTKFAFDVQFYNGLSLRGQG